jgi:DNA-directed RNA polymerase subunit M/transcription elongation factor TFIIS
MAFRRHEAILHLQQATNKTQEWAMAVELGLYAQTYQTGVDCYWATLYAVIYILMSQAHLTEHNPFMIGCVKPIAWNIDHQRRAEHPGVPAVIEEALEQLSMAVQDKTLGSKATQCIMCKSTKIKFSMRQTRRGDEAADYHKVCESCGYRQIIKG